MAVISLGRFACFYTWSTYLFLEHARSLVVAAHWPELMLDLTLVSIVIGDNNTAGVGMLWTTGRSLAADGPLSLRLSLNRVNGEPLFTSDLQPLSIRGTFAL